MDEGVAFGNCRIYPLLFANDLELLVAISQQGLQNALIGFQLRASKQERKSAQKRAMHYVSQDAQSSLYSK